MTRTFAFGLATAATVALAGWLAGTREVRAPEPVVLTEPLGNALGATAYGYYVSTGNPVTAYRYPALYVSCTGPVATGKPCNVGPANADDTITGTLVVLNSGGSKKCRCLI